MRQTLGALYLRARQLYPDLRRRIEGITVELDDNDGAHVQIASTPIP